MDYAIELLNILASKQNVEEAIIIANSCIQQTLAELVDDEK